MGREQISNGKRPMETASDAKVRLCFKSQDECKEYFAVSEDMKIQNLLQAYCRRRQMEYRTVVFLYDGKSLGRRGTVNQVGLVDQAVIEVMIHQTGGGA